MTDPARERLRDAKPDPSKCPHCGHPQHDGKMCGHPIAKGKCGCGMTGVVTF